MSKNHIDQRILATLTSHHCPDKQVEIGQISQDGDTQDIIGTLTNQLKHVYNLYMQLRNELEQAHSHYVLTDDEFDNFNEAELHLRKIENHIALVKILFETLLCDLYPTLLTKPNFSYLIIEDWQVVIITKTEMVGHLKIDKSKQYYLAGEEIFFD